MKEVTPCSVCSKPTASECSHVDCPNRRRVTAQPVGAYTITRGSTRDGSAVNGDAFVRRPYFED